MSPQILELNVSLRPDGYASGLVNPPPAEWQPCWLYVHDFLNEYPFPLDNVLAVPCHPAIEAENFNVHAGVIWPPNLNTPPPQVIKPPVQVPQNLAAQVYRDENPDKFVLSLADQKAFRKLYPVRKMPLLPAKDPKDSRPTLVLDLDETLIHTTFEIPSNTQDYETLYVNLRPFVKPFLKAVAQWYEIVIYTASLPSYANAILDTLDPTDEIFEHRLFREHCSFFHGVYVKDLESLGRPLDKTVFVDNFPGAYMMQPLNALPVRSFVGSPADGELFQVMKLLRILRFKDDFQPLLHRYRTHWKNIHFNPDQPDEEGED